MPLLHKIREKLQEECEQKQAYVHTVDIGIGGDNHIIVAQAVNAVLDVQGSLQQVEFFILINHFSGETERVERLTTQGEHCLGLHITDFGDGAGSRIALGEEYRRRQLAVLVTTGVVEVHAAVAQLAVVQVHLLGAFTRKFGDSGHGFALTLALLYLFEEHLRGVEILVKEVVKFLFQEIADVFRYCRTFGTHVTAAELSLGLRFEHWLLHLDAHGCNHAVADVGVFEILSEILLDGSRHRLLESCKMRAALSGVLAVDKRVILLAILVGVSDGNLYILSLEMDYRIKRLLGHVGPQKVEQTVARHEPLTVEHDGQTGVEVGVIAQERHYKLVVIVIVAENGVVRGELHKCTVGLVGRFLVGLHQQLSAAELGTAHKAVAVTLYDERIAQRIHGLDTHAV